MTDDSLRGKRGKQPSRARREREGRKRGSTPCALFDASQRHAEVCTRRRQPEDEPSPDSIHPVMSHESTGGASSSALAMLSTVSTLEI